MSQLPAGSGRAVRVTPQGLLVCAAGWKVDLDIAGRNNSFQTQAGPPRPWSCPWPDASLGSVARQMPSVEASSTYV